MLESRPTFLDQQLSFWPDEGALDLPYRVVLVCKDDVDPVGRFPGVRPSFHEVIYELAKNRSCWGALREPAQGGARDDRRSIELVVGRLLVRAETGTNREGQLRLKLWTRGGVEFASNNLRARVLSRGRVLKHRGVAIMRGHEFNQLERDGDAEAPARFWRGGDFARQIVDALSAASGRGREPAEAAPRAPLVSPAERQVLATLTDYVNAEHELEEVKARQLPPFVFTAMRAEPRASDHRLFFRLELDAPSARRLAQEKVSRLVVDEGDGEGFPLQIEETTERGELIVSVGRQIEASRIPRGGRLLYDVPQTTKKVRLRVIDSLAEGRHPWLAKLAANVYDAPRVRPPELSDLPATFNPSQARAVQLGVSTPDYLLVLGPPGTGKTTVILEWVKRFVAQGKRVLIATQNNKAVDNVLERLAKHPQVECVRLGNESKVMGTVSGMLLEVKARSIQAKLIERTAASLVEVAELRAFVDALLARLPSYVPAAARAAAARAELEQAARERAAAQHEWAAACEAIAGCQARLRELAGQGPATAPPCAGRPSAWLALLVWWLVSPVRLLRTLRNRLLARRVEAALEGHEERAESARGRAEEAAAREGPAKRELDAARARRDGLAPPSPALLPALSFELDALPHDVTAAQRLLVAERARLDRIGATVGEFRTTMTDERQAGLLPTLLSLVDVVGATCIGIESRPQFREVPFDVTIVDESGQIQLHNVMVPLSRAPKAILVGDHKQLPPVVDEALANELTARNAPTDYLEKSWFELLWDAAPPSRKAMLDTQFRCPAVISDYISKEFYESKYYAGRGMEGRERLLSFAKSNLLIIDTSAMPDRFESSREADGRSEVLDNPLETRLVVSVLRRALAERPELGDDPEGIGVIVPYKNHVERVRAAVEQAIRSRGLARPSARLQDMIASVDSFQGQERRLIVFTLTRSNPRGSVGFLQDARRLNVAMTRAKQQLVVVGDFSTLAREGKPGAGDADFKQKMRALHAFGRSAGHLVSAPEWLGAQPTRGDAS